MNTFHTTYDHPLTDALVIRHQKFKDAIGNIIKICSIKDIELKKTIKTTLKKLEQRGCPLEQSFTSVKMYADARMIENNNDMLRRDAWDKIYELWENPR